MVSSKWYCKQNGQKTGPLSSAQIKQLAENGQLRPDDMLLLEGAGKWIPAASVKGLFKPQTPRRGRAGLLAGACAAAALLGGFGTWGIVNALKQDDEPDNRVAVKPGDSTPKPSDDSEKPDDSTKKPPADDGVKKPPPGDGKPEEPPPSTDKKPPDKKPADKPPPEPAKPDEAETKRLAEFQRYLKAARALQEAKQYEAAVKALTEAVKLVPDSKDALDALKAAEDLRQESAAADRARLLDEDRMRDFRLLMENGQASMKRKQYDLAVAAFADANKLKPGDEDVFAALRAAEKARDAITADAAARAARKERIDAYRQWMTQGRTALFTNRQYDAAIQAFGEAQKLFPGDLVAAGFIKEAERARNAEANAQILQQQLVQEQLWLQAGLRNVLAEGRLALAAGNLDLAARAFTITARLAPNDPAVIQAVLELRQAQALVGAQANFQALIRSGRDALQARRFDDAVRAFNDASFLAPGDFATQELLRDATRQRDEARLAEANQRMQTDRLRELVAAGRAAIGRKNLDAAGAALAAARQIAPADADVLRALGELDQARNAALAGAERQKRLDLYQQAMKAGLEARNAKRFGDAIRSFNDAARLVRDDRQSIKLLQDADNSRVEAQLAEKAQGAAKQDDEKRMARVRDLLRAGRTALGNYQYDSADRLFTEASKLAPADGAVQQAIAEVDQARRRALQFNLHAETQTLRLNPGGRVRLRVDVDRRGRNGYQGPIEVELRHLPAGVSATHVTIPAGQGGTQIELSAAGNAPLGVRNNITLEGKVRGIPGHVTSPAFTVNVQKK